MRIKPLVAGGLLSMTLLAAACGSSSTSSTTGAPTTQPGPAASSAGPSTGSSAGAGTPAPAPAAGAVDPNAPEVVEPGDIPDNQVFIVSPAPDGTYSIKVPEGWARSAQHGVVTFSDKYNAITVQAAPSTMSATVASVHATGLADVMADPTFKLIDVTTVTRKAGNGVVATYQIGSAPNAVTGKKALLAVERYFFAHNATTVELTLSGAKGADNVDPWKIVTDSLSWT